MDLPSGSNGRCVGRDGKLRFGRARGYFSAKAVFAESRLQRGGERREETIFWIWIRFGVNFRAESDCAGGFFEASAI